MSKRKYFLKEKNGDQRIFTIFGFKIVYNKIRSRRFNKRGTATDFDLKFEKARIAPRYRTAFESLTDGDVCIDCGCNAGSVSDVFLHQGAFTYAFEPHPYLFEALSKKYHNVNSIELINKAVWDRNTDMDLHVQKVKQSEVLNLEGTTLFGNRIDARVESKYTVAVIDLCEFISKLGRRVNILKIDVEGAEFEIIDQILEQGLHGEIDHIFCETHPHFFTDGEEKLAVLEGKIKQVGATNIHLDWV